jgi:hypothetical protein
MKTLMFQRLAPPAVCRLVGLVAFLTAINLLQAQYVPVREPAGPSSRKTGLVITEIMYNPRAVPGQTTNNTHEFIELFNSKPWNEDISGFSVTGAVSYVFPSNTVLQAGAYLVLARVPGLIVTNYGVTNVVGPWVGANTNRLPVDGGVVQLRNRQNALLLEVDYADSPPWPETADGTGHSLSLVRPSYGENDPRAWGESDRVGGSPGGPDSQPAEPLASVVINELQNHSDPEDWIELYNHSNTPVDLSGAWLSDDPLTNKYRIPIGTTIAARGFRSWSQSTLGFELFAGGETIFLWNSNQTRVIDVVDFRGASNNVPQGRYPDGGPFIYGMSSATRDGPNSKPYRYGVVINEIMYNPISGNSDDEYVEIYNRAGRTLDISGWEFPVGITYVFPTNAQTMNMPAGAHWVVARNPANLFLIYTNLSTNNTFGPYTGTLANGGERLLLSAADYDLVGSTNVKLQVAASDLIYGDGGKWGFWSDGLGSSLELIDPEADVHFPSNWGDSNDTGESQWTSIEYNGPLGDTLGSPVNDSVILMLQGIGECLVDEVEVRADGGANLVANGGFEAGLAGWTPQGSHDLSTIETGGFAGAQSLHLRASSRGDNQANRILSAPFVSPIPPGTTNVSIRAKVRWFRGHPEILLRLHGSATEAYGRLSLPRRLGSPGQVNSRRIANIGPAVTEVKHSPVLPAASQPIVVTARAADSHPISSVTLRYRVDPTPTYTDVTMRDDGTGGDDIANDGIWGGTIPGQPAGNMVAFYVQAQDNQGAIGTFPNNLFPPAGLPRCWPNDAVARECVVRWGEVQMPGDFATYHLWVTAVNSNRWHTRAPESNAEMDGTFVYNNTRVIYNAMPLFSGSPWHRTNSSAGPAGPYRVDYEMNFPEDEPLLGAGDFVLNNPGNPDRFTISDQSAVAEQTVYKIFEGMGMVHNHRRYFHMFVNGSQRSTAYERPGNFIFEDSQQPNGDMINQWFANDAGGQLFKVEDWFEFHENGYDITAYDDADLARRTMPVAGVDTLVPGPYRYKFRKRSVNVGSSANDYTAIFQLINAVSPVDNPTNPVIDMAILGNAIDWEMWMRHFAIQRAVGNYDSYGWERGKNDYLYGTAAGFVHMPWDIDYSLGLGRPANEPLFDSNDPRVAAMFNTPAIVRAYWRAFLDLVSGPFSNTALDPHIDARVHALTNNNVNIDLNAVATIKGYIADRRAYLQSQLDTVAAPFGVVGPVSFTTNNNLLIIVGTAPVNVKDVILNGAVYPVTWINATNFTIRVVLNAAVNNYVIQGLDRFGNFVPGASNMLTVNYNGPVVNPVGALIINEVMYSTASPNTQFVEILNRVPINFDLSGWRIDGLNFTFPAGSIVTNRQIIVVARNRDVYYQTYGRLPFAVCNANLSANGQRVVLVKPGVPDTVVDGIAYEPGAPWPAVTNGVSIQLIDVGQDNSRAANWTADFTTFATPGLSNSVAATMQAFAPLWLNEVQFEDFTGPLDNMGEPEPWLELFNAGSSSVSLNGYYLADNFTSNLLQWPFPAITLAPGEHKLVWMDGEPAETDAANLHAGFRIDYQGTLALVRVVASQPQIVDHLAWKIPNPNLSYGSYPDGQSVFRYTLQDPTPGATNVHRTVPIMINEWLTANTTGIADPADGLRDDWIELYNPENAPVDLGGYYLTDDLFAPTKFQIPSNGQYRVPARSNLLVWADNSPGQNSPARGDLHVNFRLESNFGYIGLYAPDGTNLIDSVAYGQQYPDVSEGRYSDGAGQRFLMTRTTPRLRNSVTNYNSRPVFPPLGPFFATPGTTVTYSIAASDPDQLQTTPPPYSIVSAPFDSRLNQGGLYRWIIPTNQPYGEYPITLRVTDNGTPPRSDTTTFTVTLRPPAQVVVVGTNPPPVLYGAAGPGGQFTFTIGTSVGHTYRVTYKDDLDAPTWTQLDRDFVAANPYASITDSLASPRRFYRVEQLD